MRASITDKHKKFAASYADTQFELNSVPASTTGFELSEAQTNLIEDPKHKNIKGGRFSD
jgi:hypothetical protein